jgi:hypothetical protein
MDFYSKIWFLDLTCPWILPDDIKYFSKRVEQLLYFKLDLSQIPQQNAQRREELKIELIKLLAQLPHIRQFSAHYLEFYPYTVPTLRGDLEYSNSQLMRLDLCREKLSSQVLQTLLKI